MILSMLGGSWALQTLLPAFSLRRRTNLGGSLPELALTFDDGPDPLYTGQVLEILSQFGVQASFFLVGTKARRHPEVVRAISAAGHDVGNHSHAHFPPWLQTPWGAFSDHMRANREIAEALGRMPEFARAPWGFPNAGQWWAIARLQQKYAHWTVHAYDWKPGITPGAIHRNVMRQVAPGGIVLLHDAPGYPGDPRAMIEALPRLIIDLQDRFRLVPLRHWCGSADDGEALPLFEG